MAALPVQTMTQAGVVPTFNTAAGGGDTFAGTGQESVHIINGSGGSINVTFVAQNACSHGTVHDRVVAVAAGAQKVVTGLSKGQFNDASGNVNITYSGVTSLTVAVYRPG